MLVKGKVLSTELFPHKGGQGCRVALMLTDPMEPVLCTFWASQVESGAHRPYEALAGKGEAMLPIRVEVFNGKVQYNLAVNARPVVLDKPAPARAAS
jgi:hypothetical protein